MNVKKVAEILKNTDFVHMGGTKEELQVAEYLAKLSEEMGAKAHLETFEVQMAEIQEAVLTVDGKEIPCKGYFNCGSGTVEADFLYLPSTDPASLIYAKDKIVLIDTGLPYFGYHDLLDAGVKGIITYDGNVNYNNRDIDQKELRAHVHQGEKLLAVNINVKDAVKLVDSKAKTAKITVKQDETMGESRNVVAEIPGSSDEWIVLSAHYDTTSLSHGAYDNMTGCIGLLGIMEEMAKIAPNRYGLKFVFCGSEERGLLGSKAFVKAHEEELSKYALNINLDMIGSIMGKFIACASAEEKLVSYIEYLSQEIGFGIKAWQGVYSSDSTPFADRGVPAVSFARGAGNAIAPIHCRYDTKAVVSEEQCLEDIEFLSYFTDRMANAVKCPVSREIPEKVKTELDEYMARKRKA